MSDFDYKMPAERFNITRPSKMRLRIDELEKKNQRLREENEDLRGILEHLEGVVCDEVH